MSSRIVKFLIQIQLGTSVAPISFFLHFLSSLYCRLSRKGIEWSSWEDYALTLLAFRENHLFVTHIEPWAHWGTRKFKDEIQPCFERLHIHIRSKGGSVVMWVTTVTAKVHSIPLGAEISTGPRISPWSEWGERRADERRGLTLPFKSLSLAPLSARIDLALPWIHPGRQQERMHKAHYSEHAYSHTCTHMEAHTRTNRHTQKHPGTAKTRTHDSLGSAFSFTYTHILTHTY